ncbi:MAG: shikimate dehydrogenase [Vagococcus sp.]
MNQTISGYTKVAAVIANPIKHSLSPFIHNTAFSECGIDGVYVAFEVESKAFEASLESVRTLNMMGANISMPFKHRAFDYVDDVSESAKLIGAVNTVVRRGDQLVGHNTDGVGFIKSLKAKEVSIKEKNLVLLGAGGAGKAVACQCALDGARKVTIFKRHNQSFDDTVMFFKQVTQETGVQMVVMAYEDKASMQQAIQESDILINSTHIGMDNTIQEMPIDGEDILHTQLVVVDLIYHPMETLLLKKARKKGCQTINGLGMLLYQAAYAFQLWTGQEMPVDCVETKLLEKFAQRGE